MHWSLYLLRTRTLPICLSTMLLTACGMEAEQQAATLPAEAEPATRISSFGQYQGYSDEQFAEWINTSVYVEMRDGVRLAVDVTFPAVDGKAADGKFPVVWTHSRYHRNPKSVLRFLGADGSEDINSQVDANPGLQHLVRHGYIVASVQVRGGGASFGTYEGLFSATETSDAVEIIEWLARQPWSTGAIGMYGGSYLGMTQYMAASRKPEALKAIFPNVAGLDLYDTLYPGGVYRKDMMDHWGGLTRNLDVSWPAPAVEEDAEGVMLKQAIAEHQDNWDVQVEFAAGRYRDHNVPTLNWSKNGVSGALEGWQEAEVPAYHWNAWFDIFVLDAVLMYNNYQGPQKLGIGSWSHARMPDEELMEISMNLLTVEQHRWFDYWLKGIDNGIMDEPPIHYAIMDQPGSRSFRSTDQWPLSTTQAQSFYFSSGPSGSVDSVNDGLLVASPSSGNNLSDTYLVDLTTTTGTASRWDNAVGGALLMSYPDLTPNDAKSLTYTTLPLQTDINVTGHPVVTLYVNSSTRDGDFVVLLEEVDDEGISHYVTEGVLRASHRETSDAPWNNLGLPFQRSNSSDLKPLPEDRPGELVLDLHPTSNIFNQGHRIRVSVMGADADNLELPSTTPTYAVFRDRAHPSRIELPVVTPF